MSNKHLGAREAARQLGWSLDYVYKLLWFDKFHGATKVGKRWVIPADTVKAMLEAKKNGTTD